MRRIFNYSPSRATRKNESTGRVGRSEVISHSIQVRISQLGDNAPQRPESGNSSASQPRFVSFVRPEEQTDFDSSKLAVKEVEPKSEAKSDSKVGKRFSNPEKVSEDPSSAEGPTPRLRNTCLEGRTKVFYEMSLTSQAKIVPEKTESNKTVQSLREFEQKHQKKCSKGQMDNQTDRLPSQSAADQAVEYFWRKDKEFKTENLTKHFLMVKKGVEKNRETMKNHTLFLQREMAEFKNSVALRRLASKFDNSQSNTRLFPRGSEPQVSTEGARDSETSQMKPETQSFSTNPVVEMPNTSTSSQQSRPTTFAQSKGPHFFMSSSKTKKEISSNSTRMKQSKDDLDSSPLCSASQGGQSEKGYHLLGRNKEAGKSGQRKFRQRIDRPVQPGGYFNEHEFNNIFKIINYLDNEEDIVIQRKEFRKRIKNMNERAKTDIVPKDDDEEVFLPEYEIGEVLGEGSYAIVKLVRRKDNSSNRFALKVYTKVSLSDKVRQKNLELEVDILRSLNHPNVVKIYDQIVGNRNVFLIMEYVSRNSLQDFLDNQPTGSFSESKTGHFFAQLVEAVAHLHSKNIVHRDLKLQNVLVDKKHNLKLIDFGFAVRVESDTLLKVFCGTPSYMSPEIVSRTPYEGKASDIWALGCLLYKMVIGTFPFRGVSEEDLFNCITNGIYEFKIPVSASLKNLLSKMLCVKPADRISAAEVRQHPWFAEIFSKEYQATRIEPEEFTLA